MPEFVGIEGWMNTAKPVSKKSLEGQVVLLYFWNYSDIRSFSLIKVMDYWNQKYGGSGLQILGIHSPAYDFEKNQNALKKAVKRLKIAYPVALDSSRSLWGIYNIQKSPAYILVDARGRIRENSADISFERMERSLRALLTEKGATLLTDIDTSRFPERGPSAQNFVFGFQKLTGYGNSERLKADVVQTFDYPQNFSIDFFYLKGAWKFSSDHMEVSRVPASLTLHSNASGIYLIAGSKRDVPVPVEILINGKPLAKTEKGLHVKIKRGKSYLSIHDFKPYEILRQRGQGYRTIELRFEDSDAALYRMDFE
jgi:hypothetical protein